MITPAPPFHFPTSREYGAFPFPTSQSMADQAKADTASPAEPDADELRLMADTMPGDGPGE